MLDDDEHLVVTTRTHVKGLLGPALLLIVVAGVAGFLSALPSGAARPLLQVVVWGLALVVIGRLVVKPFLVWLTTTHTLTDRRLITRSGILSRRGHDLPLSRISDVSFERGIVDRLLGSGTLVVSVAGGHGQVLLRDVPNVERLHLRLTDLLFDGADESRRAFFEGYRTDDGS